LTLVSSPSNADIPGEPSYTSPAVREWAAQFLAGKRTDVIASIESNLRSPQPDPMAAGIWCDLEGQTEPLQVAWASVKDPALRRGLGILPGLRIAFAQYRYDEMTTLVASKGSPLTPDELALVGYKQAYTGEWDAATKSVVQLLRLAPDRFRYVYKINNWLDHEPLRGHVEAAIRSGQIPSDSLFAKFLAKRPAHLRFSPIARIEALQAWPNLTQDASALSTLGDDLKQLQQYDAEAQYQAESNALYPFLNDVSDLAVAQLLAGKFSEAKESTAAFASLLVPPGERQEFEKSYQYAVALVAAGELGAARETLAAVEHHCLIDARCLQLEANLERVSGRPVEAAHFLARIPESAQDYLIQMQRAEDLSGDKDHQEEAWDVLQKLADGFPQRSPWYYDTAQAVLGKLGAANAKTRRLQLIEEGLARTPNVSFLLQDRAEALGEIGRTADAIKQLEALFDIEIPTDARLALYRKLQDTADPAKAAAALQALRARFPMDDALWQDASNHDTDKEARIDTWKAAIAANPERAFAYSNLQTVYVNAKDWTAANDLMNAGMAATAAASLGERLDMAFAVAWEVQQHIATEAVDADQIKRATEALDFVESAYGGPTSDTLNYRASLLVAQGDTVGAAKLLMRAFELAPDNWNIGFSVVTKYENELGKGRVMRAAYHYLDRNPFEGARLSSLAHINAMWITNPVETLRLEKLIQERAPGSYNLSYVGQANGQLGAFADDFEMRYGKINAISPSDRYVGWYDSSRHDAQGQSNAIKSLDFDHDVATLRLSDGHIVSRGWDRYGGGATLIQVGKGYVKAEYNAAGNVERIEESGGRVLSLKYSDQDQIVELDDGDRKIRFEYGSNNKPSVIEEIGVGRITTTYDDDGSIKRVESSGGRAVALAITAAIGDLQSFTSALGQTRIDSMPEIDTENPAGLRLQSAYEAAEVEAAAGGPKLLPYAHAAVAYGTYLVQHAADAASNEAKADEVLRALIDKLANSRAPEAMALESQAIGQLVELDKEEYPDGLPAGEWNRWSANHQWLLRHEATVPLAHQVEADEERQPLTLLQQAQWLPKSFLSSPGYWRSLPDPRLKDAQAVLVRQNHDILVGLRRGLMVFRAGHWSWYGYDSLERRLSPDVEGDALSASSDVQALAETADGTLWIGTASGLLRVRGDYEQHLQRFSSTDDGLASGFVISIAGAGKNLYVATQGGTSWSPDGEHLAVISALSGADVTSLKSASYVPETNTMETVDLDKAVAGNAEAAPNAANDAPVAAVVAASAKGAWLLRGGQLQHLSLEPVKDALLAGDSVFELRNDGLWTYPLPARGSTPSAIPLRGTVELVKKINGLAVLPLSESDYGIAALTDDGLSIYREGHFEYQAVPLAVRAPSVNALASRDLRTVLLTSDGVYSIERGQAIEDTQGQVYDLLADEAHQATYVARGSRLDVVSHAHPELGATPFAAVRATHLAVDAQGRLIANDGNTIVRLDADGSMIEELFSASHQPSATASPAADRYPEGALSSLLVASDGTVWAASGASVYRWKQGMETPEEFSTYVDSAKFPGRTDLVSKVIETLDHRILVICSDESHIYYHGISLSGGVLEWDGTVFKPNALRDDSTYWFINSYTPLDEHTAIVGTSGSFARVRDRAYSGFPELKDSSYEKLRLKTQVFLGTRGARLGDDTWLFGSAGGVLAYQNGAWFYPDRLNWLLPEDYVFKGHYGDRAVHAVATDAQGRIYAGTDRGLLIYDSGGGDSRAFLLSNQDYELEVESIEQDKLRREQDILIASLDPNDPSAKTVHELQEIKRHVAQLQQNAEPHATMAKPLATASAPQQSSDRSSQSLPVESSPPGEQQAHAQDLVQSKQKYLEELVKLKSSRLGLHDAMEPDPLYVSSIKDRIAENEVLLQYIPTTSTLFINVITHTDARLIRVDDVSAKELNERALRSWFRMAKGHVSNRSDAVEAAIEGAGPTLNEDLSWLYERLMRPAEGVIQGRKNIFIIGSGSLNYLPFAALIRDSSSSSPEYAVQRYNIGYMPSLYLLERMKGQHNSRGTDDLVMGDPDKSLQWAATEARDVDEILKSRIPPQVGADANAANLIKYAPKAGILHLATHGYLDAVHPENSYLLLAKSHLTMPDAMSLPLNSSDLVVLSACESGIGGDGMEYLNMAYAFSYAGAPTVLATLWRIPDAPTSKLMDEFYRNVKGGDDHFAALAKAQQWMLKQGDAEKDPSAWAAFMPLGRP
jgi:CHAT domain-containing protein